MIISIVVIICLIFLNGLFAMGELALISCRKARLVSLQKQKIKGIDRALRLAEDPQSFLPTIQVGITLVSIFEGAFGGAKIEAYLGIWLRGLPVIGPIADDLSILLVVIAITSLMLVFGELVPKQLALREPELIAAKLAWFLDILSQVMAPAVWVLGKSSAFILKLLGVHKKARVSVTEEELRAYIAEGAQVGVLEVEERNMIERLLRLADRPVRAVMRPRNKIVSVERYMPKNDLNQVLKESSYAKLVVCEGGIDNPVGIVLVNDLLSMLLDGKPVSIEACLQSPLVVPDSIPALDALERLRADQLGILLVLDEYGSFEGIVTVSDIFKAIVGEVNYPLEAPRLETDISYEYILDGFTPIDNIKDQLDLENLPAEGDYHTLAGLILALLRRVPLTGDKVAFSGWLFEVLEMEGRRILKVRASRQPVASN